MILVYMGYPSNNIPRGTGHYYTGLDVGSTTVKGVVLDDAQSILYSSYQRHEARQIETVIEFLSAVQERFGNADISLFVTGSGGATIASVLGCRYVQEVNAVTLVVEKLYPDINSVIEIGGQDAKAIIWSVDPSTGRKRIFTTMNDKCAGGTGTVIDRIAVKLNITQQYLSNLKYAGIKIHAVAGRCGVFAEMDINSLQKQGVPPEELMASLFEAIVQQNLSVLTRGNTLNPDVLLLGGPNTFIPALKQAWQHNIPLLWEQRGIKVKNDPAFHIRVPDNAQFFAAIGSIFYGISDGRESRFSGAALLSQHLGKIRNTYNPGLQGHSGKHKDAVSFLKSVSPSYKADLRLNSDKVIKAYLGIDGGSTSTKGVLITGDGEVIERSYILSRGNPIDDTKQIILSLNDAVITNGKKLEILGAGTTGYAKDMIKEAVGADVAIVETVAHTKSALHFYKDVDVICDVGGQDIKIIFLDNGRVKDFRLNTQCSAGNGYFLQNTANRFGYEINEYAEVALKAARAPSFNYGCAVFLEADIVNFQQQGFTREEIMAGLADVLPRNIWLYVVQESNLGKFGKNFVLQGGTHNNLAVVKAQHDFIKARVPDANIIVHKYTGESGAIGAAIEAISVLAGRPTGFIGIDAVRDLAYSITQDQTTRCNFCKNKCLRIFIDMHKGVGKQSRFIVASCEKGMADNIDAVKTIKSQTSRIKKDNPNFADIMSREAFSTDIESSGYTLKHPVNKSILPIALRKRTSGKYLDSRKHTRIGIPRALNMYGTAPFFTGYLKALGVPGENIVFSDVTDELMYKHGTRRGSIDQCFPSKAALAHVHNLIYEKNVDAIFYPIMLTLKTELVNTINSHACPSATIMPEAVKAAFTKQDDVFQQRGIKYLNPVLNMSEPELFRFQMYRFFKEWFGVSMLENRHAIASGELSLERFYTVLRNRAMGVLRRLEKEKRIGIAVLGRPYHADPGINHDILSELQKRGYPVFTIESLPIDREALSMLFGDELAAGELENPMSIDDVWKNSYSENTNKKLWAAKYVARHKNLVAVDLSSFRCGNDAPIYSTIESILKASDTPYFTFHDIDENKPAGSIKIRIETIDYFLKQYSGHLRNETEDVPINLKSIAVYIPEQVGNYD
ncbi:MAG: acyl-CoA dehydratase activase [Deltaproteobacteria bacterium]|nr:acyl-CoA dehydratase activase [Deltaproteobacteria bacterium]